jgi:hypothetical protein
VKDQQWKENDGSLFSMSEVIELPDPNGIGGELIRKGF